MDRKDGERISAIVREIALQPRSQWPALLDERCDSDVKLRREVERALEHELPRTRPLSRRETEPVGDPSPPPASAAPPGRLRPLTAGDLFAGRYRIVTQLGSGAMGEVYRAEDLTLGVTVALKRVHPQSLLQMDHLLGEVRLARQITHPAVCRVFDVGRQAGELFYTMEYVDGEDLAHLLVRIGRFAPERVLRIARQLCAGLAAAHAEGVLHRDLKLLNVLVDPNGDVRISDFGIAVRKGESAGASEGFGTPPYEAPELLDGAPPSEQSDLYALGVLLYELLLGSSFDEEVPDPRAPGARPRPPSEIAPGVDPRLDRVLMQALDPGPNRRPASAEAMLAALGGPGEELKPAARDDSATGSRWWRSRWAGAGALLGALALVVALAAGLRGWRTSASALQSGPPSVAIVPFEDLSPNPESDPFAEGMHEDLLTQLSHLGSLRVIARTSVQQFRHSERPIEEIAEELGARAVLAGSVRRWDDRLRVNARLVDARSGDQLWAESYDRAFTAGDLFDIQRDLAREIALALDAELTRAEQSRLEQRPTESLEAYDLYLKGRHEWARYSYDGFRSAAGHFLRAIQLDPDFALAYAWMGLVYSTATSSGWLPASEGYPAARLYARDALERDPEVAEAHLALARVHHLYEWNSEAARASFQRALELAPSSALAHQQRANFLSSRGDFDAALQHMNISLALDPASPYTHTAAAWCHFAARRFDGAVRATRKALELDPDFEPAWAIQGLALVERGALEEGLAALERFAAMAGDNPFAMALLAYGRGRNGRAKAARAIAADLEQRAKSDYVPSGDLALAHLGLGDLERALELLALALDERSPIAVRLELDPTYDPLRGDPRFEALLARVRRGDSGSR